MGTTRVRGLIAAAGATALAISALAPAASAQDGTMQMWGRDIDQVLYNELIETWNAENPDKQIELTIIPSAEYVAKVAAAAAGGVLAWLAGGRRAFRGPIQRLFINFRL